MKALVQHLSNLWDPANHLCMNLQVDPSSVECSDETSTLVNILTKHQQVDNTVLPPLVKPLAWRSSTVLFAKAQERASVKIKEEKTTKD